MYMSLIFHGIFHMYVIVLCKLIIVCLTFLRALQIGVLKYD